jgi:predicted PurR-regulated permease PerM
MQSIRNPLVTAAAAVVIIAGMHAAAPIVNLVLISFLLAMSVTPLMEWAIHRGVSAGLAVTLTILGVVIGGLGLATLVGVSISSMIDELPLYEPRLIEIKESLVVWLSNLGFDVTSLLSAVQVEPGMIMNVARTVLSAGLSMVSMSLVIILIVVFILIEAAGHLGKIQKGDANVGMMARYFLFGKDVRKYVGIVALTGVIVAIGNTILLTLLGVDYPVLWGVLSFLFNFVPTFGFLFSVLPPVMMALLEFGWGTAVIVVIGFFLINSVTENVVKPRFMKSGLQMSFLLLVVSLVLWTWVLGPVGTIVGVPLTLVLNRVYMESVSDGQPAVRVTATADKGSDNS